MLYVCDNCVASSVSEGIYPGEAKAVETEVYQFIAQVWSGSDADKLLRLGRVALELQKRLNVIKEKTLIRLAAANVTFGH
eukprot:SAG11_NODE_2326_length_3518_cov_401.419713_5_plen_80_part_00